MDTLAPDRATAPYRGEVRRHTSVLARAEKRALVAIAGRLPSGVHSDHLTGLGFAALLGAAACYLYARYDHAGLLWAIPCLIVNWFGDSLDGTVARVRDRQRPRYGFYVDHVLDAIGTCALSAGLAFSGHMSPGVAAVFLAAYLLLSIEVYLATHALGTFQLSFWSVGPTELRILLIVGNLFAYGNPFSRIAGRDFYLFDVGFAIGAAGMLVVALQSAYRHGRALYELERLPQR